MGLQGLITLVPVLRSMAASGRKVKLIIWCSWGCHRSVALVCHLFSSLACLTYTWLAKTWQNMALHLMAWHGIWWHDMAFDGMTWHLMAWHGIWWHDMAFDGMTWHLMAWNGIWWHDMAFDGMTWHLMAWLGMCWHDMAPKLKWHYGGMMGAWKTCDMACDTTAGHGWHSLTWHVHCSDGTDHQCSEVLSLDTSAILLRTLRCTFRVWARISAKDCGTEPSSDIFWHAFQFNILGLWLLWQSLKSMDDNISWW